MGAIMDEEREMVLRMLKEGKITIEEADALLQELTEQRSAEEQGAVPPRPPGPSGIPDVREELRTVFRDLMDSVPKDVIRELKHAREAFQPGFFQVIRSLRGLVEGRAEAEAEEAVRAGEQIVLTNAWGDIVIMVSPDDRLRMRAVKRVWAETAEEARREAEALPVDVRREGATIEISAPRSIRRHQRSRVDVQLAVPAGVDVRLDVAKGDVEVEGLRGKIDLRIARGDVKIRSQEGAAALDVVSGDVELAAVKGDVRLDVRSGDIAVRDLSGALRGRIINGDIAVTRVGAVALDVINGDVAVNHPGGDVEVEAKSGDIALAGIRAHPARIRALSGDVEIAIDELGEASLTVETMSGDIEVGLPPSSRATVEATTRTGSITSGLTLQPAPGDGRSLRGVFNGPGGTVRLSTLSGDIEIQERRP